MDQKLLTTLLARQGIYDRNGSVYAYELLYRNPNPVDAESHRVFTGDIETSSVITQLFASLDINTIIGDKRAYINFTHNHLVQKIPCLLPKERIGVEVLETVVVDQALIDSLISLREQGYIIALDDFIYNEQTAPLIHLADIIKIDVLNQNKQQIAEQLLPLQQFKGKLLAEKIEDLHQLNNCMELGFDYFQGFFLNKPNSLKGQQITENKNILLRLLSELDNENVAIERIEEFILQIPKLSYRILRLANSAAGYRGKKIDSLLEAVKKLGINQIRDWLSLFLMSNEDVLLPDLLERTLIRAKMCEALAKLSQYTNPHQAYTVGILSTLDLFLNESMASLLSGIQLCDALNEALLYHGGKLGELLQLTIDYEKADFSQLEKSAYEKADLTRSYLEGIEYANSIMSIINKK